MTIMSIPETKTFDYAALSAEEQAACKVAAERIQTQVRCIGKGIVAIGRELLSIKKTLGHGHFTEWCRAELGISDQSARNYMRVAQQFGDKSKTVWDLSPTSLYALSAPSTPPAVREEIVARIEAGERLPEREIKDLVRAARNGRQSKVVTTSLRGEPDEAQPEAKQLAPDQARDRACQIIITRLGDDLSEVLTLLVKAGPLTRDHLVIKAQQMKASPTKPDDAETFSGTSTIENASVPLVQPPKQPVSPGTAPGGKEQTVIAIGNPEPSHSPRDDEDDDELPDFLRAYVYPPAAEPPSTVRRLSPKDVEILDPPAEPATGVAEAMATSHRLNEDNQGTSKPFGEPYTVPPTAPSEGDGFMGEMVSYRDPETFALVDPPHRLTAGDIRNLPEPQPTSVPGAPIPPPSEEVARELSASELGDTYHGAGPFDPSDMPGADEDGDEPVPSALMPAVPPAEDEIPVSTQDRDGDGIPDDGDPEPDTSDIPEVGEDFFQNTRLTRPGEPLIDQGQNARVGPSERQRRALHTGG